MKIDAGVAVQFGRIADDPVVGRAGGVEVNTPPVIIAGDIIGEDI